MRLDEPASHTAIAPTLAINDALGFKVISTRTEWQADIGDLVRAQRSGLSTILLRARRDVRAPDANGPVTVVRS